MLDALADLLPAGQCPAPLPLARWHRQDPCPALNALMRARQAAPHLEPLANLLLPRMPHGILASSTIKGEGDRPASRVIRLEEALRHQWVSWNTSQWTNTETVDCDRPDWRERLANLVARGLPPPAFIVISPWKGTAHLVWVYDRPFRCDDPVQARVRKGIKRGLQMAFGSDPRFSNRLQKNPWHRRDEMLEPDPDVPCGDPAVWQAYLDAGHPLTYHTEIHRLVPVTTAELLTPLLALADEQDFKLLAPRPRPRPDAPPVIIPGASPPAGRGNNAFFLACAQAVRRARTGDATVIQGIVRGTAAAMRMTVSPGSQAEIVRSITAWMNTKWIGPLDGRPGRDPGVGRRAVDAGVMTGEAADGGPQALAEWQASTLTEKRQAAGKRSGRLNAARTQEAMRAAIAAAAGAGERVTQALIAARSGLSMRTVKAHWHTLDLGSEPVLEKVQNGLICPCAPSRGVASSASENLNPFSSLTPAQVALRMKRSQEALKRERAAAVAYRCQAARMLARGAKPEAVFPPPPGSSATLREAHAVALAAQATARRRSENRRKRLEAAARAADRDAWHAEHAGDSIAWEARLADLGHQKVIAVERILRASGNQDAIDRVEMAYASIFGAEHRARQRAQGEATPDRKRVVRRNRRIPLNRPDETDLLIPW